MTQRDIARIAGVSQAAVSMVLNDGKSAITRIPAETRDRVLAAIRDTGYVADPIARRMVAGRNRILGVFTYEPAFPSGQADFYTPLLHGIEEAAEALGYDLLLMTAAGRNGDGKKKIFDERSRLRLADGCVILGGKFDRDELARLVAGDYPYVAVGRRDDAGGKVRYVGADYVTATADLTERACALGHRKFAFFGSPGETESLRDRWAGFEAGLERGGGKLVHLQDDPQPSPEQQMTAMQSSGATVAFFGELIDAMAYADLVKARGMGIPHDVSIVALGSRNRVLSHHLAFASYDIPREQMARDATDLLVRTLDDPGLMEQVRLPCKVTLGETLGPPGTDKRVVIK